MAVHYQGTDDRVQSSQRLRSQALKCAKCELCLPLSTQVKLLAMYGENDRMKEDSTTLTKLFASSLSVRASPCVLVLNALGTYLPLWNCAV